MDVAVQVGHFCPALELSHAHSLTLSPASLTRPVFRNDYNDPPIDDSRPRPDASTTAFGLTGNEDGAFPSSTQGESVSDIHNMS